MNIVIYLTFDLNFNGDYNGLYKWLDSHNAIECGDSVCRINYTLKLEHLDTFEDTKEALSLIKKDIESSVNLSPKDRIYVASLFPDDKNHKRLAGRFIFGQRKSNPWHGYAVKDEDNFNVD